MSRYILFLFFIAALLAALLYWLYPLLKTFFRVHEEVHKNYEETMERVTTRKNHGKKTATNNSAHRK